ncbi:response regulator [Paenibacillus lautus]|uniref:response regulator n=1 Tax=Paenibacillus lautus TaxID=1401 RepID=UPI003D2BF376
MSEVTILMVDDEIAINKLMEIYVKNEGFTLLYAHSGQEALEIIRVQKVDQIILDVLMPRTRADRPRHGAYPQAA